MIPETAEPKRCLLNKTFYRKLIIMKADRQINIGEHIVFVLLFSYVVLPIYRLFTFCYDEVIYTGD